MNGTGAKIKNFADACSKCTWKVLGVCWLFLVVHSYLSMPCLFYFLPFSSNSLLSIGFGLLKYRRVE